MCGAFGFDIVKHMQKTLLLLKNPRLILASLAVIGIGVALIGFSSWREQQEIAWLNSLASRHPEGEQYVQELLQAKEELKDSDKKNDFSAYLRTGIYLNLLGEKKEALEWYEKALAQDPTNILALNNSANIYNDLGQYDASEDTWLKLIAAYPNRPAPYRSLGYLYWYRLYKSPGDIEDFFKRGLAATNNDPDLLTWLISYFQETGNNEKFAEYANLLNAQGK